MKFSPQGTCQLLWHLENCPGSVLQASPASLNPRGAVAQAGPGCAVLNSTPTLPFPSAVTLGKLHLSKPQIAYLKGGHTNSACLPELCD